MSHDVPRGRERSYSRSRSKSFSRSQSRSLGSRRRYSRSRSRSPMARKRRFAGPRDNPHPSRCLGVFGLNLRTRERDLYDVFIRYGDIDDITLVFDNFTGRSRGFGFVYFRHVEDAKAAKEDCHGMEIDGRPIRVDYSVTERAHTPTPGIYMGKPSRYGAGGGGGGSGGRRYERSPPRRRGYRQSRSRSVSYDRRY